MHSLECPYLTGDEKRYRLMPGQAFDVALAEIQTQLAPTQKQSEDVDTSGHAELELADGRWLRMTVSRTSEGGSIICP